MKIAIIGLGGVGEACAHALATADVARRLVLMNRTVELAQASARDLRQARAWGRRLDTEVGPLDQGELLEGCDLIVLTLGRRLRGAQSRADTFEPNCELLETTGLIDALHHYAGDAVVLVVTNPVELMVTWLQRETAHDAKRIVGLGTTVDSARISQHLGSVLEVDAQSAWLHLVGEHGPTLIACDCGRLHGLRPEQDLKAQVDIAMRRTKSDARKIRSLSENIGARKARRVRDALEDDLSKESGPDIEHARALLDDVESRLALALAPPATRYAIAAAVVTVARAIGQDQRRVMTVSALPPPRLGLPSVALALPFSLDASGVGTCLLRHPSPELTTLAQQFDAILNDA